MKAFAVKGKAFTTSSNAGPLARYRNDIRAAYVQAIGEDSPPYHGPVEVVVSFHFRRPKGHYNTNGSLKGSKYKTPAPTWVTKKPDIDKLCRAVCDALSGFCYDDDEQVVSINAVMKWEAQSSTDIKVFPMDDMLVHR